ncbi:uncharacterized protein LOC120219827 [Hyaena hyaena]|uniref:uncharacterized protein LOC120219827 n=1 Tax=Hyaena hyaena TaxID=95912 RepID=UPI0019222E1F|nr:uncharacterized protein LOC120219827 [Hyaena hyaena]
MTLSLGFCSWVPKAPLVFVLFRVSSSTFPSLCEGHALLVTSLAVTAGVSLYRHSTNESPSAKDPSQDSGTFTRPPEQLPREGPGSLQGQAEVREEEAGLTPAGTMAVGSSSRRRWQLAFPRVVNRTAGNRVELLSSSRKNIWPGVLGMCPHLLAFIYSFLCSVFPWSMDCLGVPPPAGLSPGIQILGSIGPAMVSTWVPSQHLGRRGLQFKNASRGAPGWLSRLSVRLSK